MEIKIILVQIEDHALLNMYEGRTNARFYLFQGSA